jgi:hypothetical protein
MIEVMGPQFLVNEVVSNIEMLLSLDNRRALLLAW